MKKKKIILTIALIFAYLFAIPQCQLSCGINNTTNHTIEICAGDSITLNATGGCSILMNNDFNASGIGAGWSSNAVPMFNNPCNAIGGTADGTIYLWIGPATNFPRRLSTQAYNLNCPGSNVNIQFDMKYAKQGENSPCEGPDLPTEGVHLQYSTNNGVSWTDIQYWDPLGGNQANLINWSHYNINAPAAANSPATMFSWYQTNTSGNDYDHWGLDNVSITFSPPPITTLSWWEGATQISNSANCTVIPSVGLHIYKVIVQNTCGHMIEDSVFVNVKPNPHPTFVVTSPICTGQQCTILYTGAASGTANFDWNFDNANIISGAGAGPIIVNWNSAIPHIVTLQVTDNGCSSIIDSIVVDNFPSPLITFTGNPLSGCAPLTVQFTETISNDTIINWYWNFGDVTSADNTSTLQHPAHTFINPGNYNILLKAITDNGCTDSIIKNLYIQIYPFNIADYTTDVSLINVDDIIAYIDMSINATSWVWDFGDGTILTSATPTHSYSTPGKFTVCLISTNIYGCTDTICKPITINQPLSFFVPNVFTPNGDGINELFLPLATGVAEKQYALRIFNRWGMQIFYTDNISAGWNGEYNEKYVPEGVYYFTVTLNDLKEITHYYSGTISVLR